jgi:hypothetical protein
VALVLTMVTGWAGTSGCLAKRTNRRFSRLANGNPLSLRLLRRPESDESHHLVEPRPRPRSGEEGSDRSNPSSRSAQGPNPGECRDELDVIGRPLCILTRMVSQLSSESESGLSYPPMPIPMELELERERSEDILERASGIVL